MNTPTAPFIALVESDGVDNDDWITDHAGDPEDIDWSTYTEGTEALVLVDYSNFSLTAVTGVVPQNIGSGITYDQKYGKRYYVFTITGLVKTLTAANYIDKFTMDNRHTTGTDFSRPYLIVKTATDTYKTFTDHNNASKEYLACNLAQPRLQLTDRENLVWRYQISGFSVWR